MVVRQKGFTLIEVLVVIFLLGVVMAIGVNLFFSILKGGSKAEIVKEVKQNGDYAISVMERMTRNAQSASCSDSSSVTIKNPDGWTTTFVCEDGRIASNSGTYLTSESVTATGCTFSCGGTTPEVVTISFTLSQKGTPVRVEERATANFQTKVSLRTYE